MKIVKFISRDTLENSRFFLQTVCAYLNTQKDGLFCSLIPRTSSLFGGDPEKSRARGTRKKTLQRGLERNSSSPLASAFFFFRGFANRNGEHVCRRYICLGIRPFICYSASQFILGILGKSPICPFAATFTCWFDIQSNSFTLLIWALVLLRKPLNIRILRKQRLFL